ncbi:WD40 repeat-like protein [Mycena vitilis]|nr:WD40 repeat-like protein [Mycena vitilis]
MTPLLSAIYDARCEITSNSINQPIGLKNNGSCVLLPSMGGWKNRAPVLAYYLLDDTSSGTQFPLKARYADVGLTEVAWHATTDEANKLMFVADNCRVKSVAPHTLDTDSHHGPLHTLAPGLLIRAGKGSVGVWDLGALPTHGPSGRARIGHRFDTSYSWRDEDDKLEASSGSGPTSTITLADLQLAPEQWHAHPALYGTLLCGIDTKESHDYSCVSLDLEHGGKTVARYLGHGGNTRAFSTSVVDPAVFLTAASDGHARLYDHRMVLPVLSLRAGTGEDDCMGVVLTHPDGIPTIFTGAARDQIIRLWDVRAQKMIYELSTGNNAVVGMTWDAPRSTLYVATQCDTMNRLGDNFDYRHVKRPRISWSWESLEREDSDSYDSDDESDYDAPCWPKNAGNAEDYFGHLFDAGDHRIFRYAFNDQPDPSILPEYGEARVCNDGSW